jgi:hypothetical protein
LASEKGTDFFPEKSVPFSCRWLPAQLLHAFPPAQFLLHFSSAAVTPVTVLCGCVAMKLKPKPILSQQKSLMSPAEAIACKGDVSPPDKSLIWKELLIHAKNLAA